MSDYVNMMYFVLFKLVLFNSKTVPITMLLLYVLGGFTHTVSEISNSQFIDN